MLFADGELRQRIQFLLGPDDDNDDLEDDDWDDEEDDDWDDDDELDED